MKKKAPTKKTATKKPSKKPATAPKSKKLDWIEIESALHALAAKAIEDFAKQHTDEIFYALYFDFPERWSGIRIHLNTPQLLRNRAEEYIASNPEHYSRRPPEAVANDIRWEPGDFGYFDVNASKAQGNRI